jgi:tetratricopeptide (TPR) repeat protein
MQSQLEEFRRKTGRVASTDEVLDPAHAENLRALGYLTSDAPRKKEKDTDSGADPKDKIQIANLMHEALIDLEENRQAEAIPKLEKVIQQEPGITSAYIELGRTLVHLKEYEKAIPALRTAVKKTPDSGVAHFELGLALVKTGDWAGAAEEYETASRLAPKSAETHFSLAAVYTRLRRIPDAMQEFETTLQLNPDHFRANLLYGRILFLEGKPGESLLRLQRAVKVHPTSSQAHWFLADAYEKLGQVKNASREREEASRLKKDDGAGEPPE